MSPSQIQAAELLGQGLTHQEVANRVGVSRRTIVRWCRDSDFKNLSYGLRSRTALPHNQEIAPIRVRIDSLSDWDFDNPLSRDDAQRELRRLEWQISIAILQKALTSLENLEFSRVRDLMNSVEIASSLARKSGEVWGGDINAAIDLLKRYDFDVIDRQLSGDESERAEEEND